MCVHACMGVGVSVCVCVRGGVGGCKTNFRMSLWMKIFLRKKQMQMQITFYTFRKFLIGLVRNLLLFLSPFDETNAINFVFVNLISEVSQTFSQSKVLLNYLLKVHPAVSRMKTIFFRFLRYYWSADKLSFYSVVRQGVNHSSMSTLPFAGLQYVHQCRARVSNTILFML